MARSTYRGRSAFPKARSLWIRSDTASAITALPAASLIIDTFITGDNPATVMRCRGMLTVQTDQIAASEAPFGAYGACIVSDQALAVGASAVPAPFIDADSDLWFLHGYFAAPVIFGDATGTHNLSQTVEFDSKAMRKFSEDESLIFVIENASAASGMSYIWNKATLIKVGRL